MSIMRDWQSTCGGSDNSVSDAESSQYSISLYPGPQWWSWCPPCRNCSQAQQRGQQRHGQAYSIGALCTGVPASAWIRTVGRRQEALCGPHHFRDADHCWRGHTVGYNTFWPETVHTGEWAIKISLSCVSKHSVVKIPLTIGCIPFIVCM